ncbi:uncharacterized protein [Primulina huaijiensis]|uniref:uncharacterized protein n=1 Tax=Primulina huaijiensis TaxID=1492673 RepID=UPI003CC75D0C
MNFLIWNVRGLRSSESQQRLHAHVKEKRVKILAILELMIDLDVGFMTRRFGFSRVISNSSGHIWVFFSEDVMAECLLDHTQFLHFRVSAPFLPTTVFCSFVYAKCDYIERRQLWTSLLQVKPDQGPWLVGGDFNVVINSSECLGSSVDAGFEGSSFTWTNKTIWKRLDRVFVSVDWCDHFHSIRVEHLIRTVSDHCPLFVSVPVFASGPSSFRFQSMWLRHHGFLQTVRLNWNLSCHLNGMHRLFVKLKRLKSHLKWWNKSVFGDLFAKLAEAEQAVRTAEAVCEADPSELHWTSLSNCNADLARVTAMEADFWRQKAACRWLEDDNGSCITSPELIQQSGAAFFQNLLTGDPFVLSCPDFSDFPLVISDLENANIAAPPSLEEVRAIVFSIHRDSVAGPDGFSSAFFQHCLAIVHQDVLDAVLDFFRCSPMPQGFTATTITLIPKVLGAQAWSDFRPISLCNVTNKIISKLLYSRLKEVAERLVSWNQSGFVPGRVISDNILLAQELTHSLSLPTRGGNVILKLDMAKAYDRVQWSFLLDVLRHYGFSEQVVSMISAYISHCNFSVNINGSLTGFFGSTRGFRQGDPLSPLLFILGAEYLPCGLDRLYRQYPAIRYRSGCDLLLSHLAYADDIIIFANGGTREMNSLMDFLHHYENCSGQLVNAVKSVIILPLRCSGRIRSRLLRITGFGEGYFPIKYLGVPLFRGNRVCSLFDPLVQMVSKKLEGWELKTLSPGSRMTLLRSVLLSVPIYMFQVVQPPLAVMERLENVFNGFLWGSRSLDKKWHWARWSRACLPVSEGGLGFRRLKDIVESFSIKLWFRFRQGSSLWAKFMQRKYCQLVHPSYVSSAGFISPTWRRLLKIRARAESGIRWRIGLGDVNFWDDIWCGDVPLSSQVLVRGDRSVRVSHFLSGGAWDFDLLCSVVPPSVAETITLIPIASGEHDSAIWVHSSDGVFSLKSAWELVRLRDQVSDIFTPCWGSWLRPTMSFFLWRFWHQWLPVDDVLQRRGFELASKCQCCEMPETFTHIFIDSPLARSVWHYFGAVFHVRIPLTSDLRLFRSAWKRHPGWTPRGHVKEFLPFIVLWFLWTARNDAKHRHLHISGETVKSQILSYLRLAHAASTVKPMHWRGVLQAARTIGIFVQLRRVHRMAIVRWLRPPFGCFKLNVDGSSRGSPGASTVGGVVRDSSGHVVVSFSEFIGVGTNVRAELWAIWRGLLISSDLHLFPLWIETDSWISILLLRSRRCCWDLEHFVTRILLLMRGRSVHLSHIYREGNSVADALAARAHTFRQYTLELGPLLCYGGCYLQASPYPPTFLFALPSVVVDLDDIYLWFLWPGSSLMSTLLCNRSLVPNSGISAAFAKLGLVRSFDLKFLPRGFLVITLACEEDYAFFWTKGVMQVGPLSIRFSKWTPEFNLQEESPIAPVWIRFPGLPLHLFSKPSLFALAKIVGKPVKMDDHTADSSRGAFARVCVEINVLEPLVKEIWVGWGDHAQEIEVIYERIPGYCMDCKMLGHSTSVCYSHGKNPKPVRPKPADRASGQSPTSTEPAPPGGVNPGFNMGTQPQLQKNGTGPGRRGRKRPVRKVLPRKNPLDSNPFEVLSHGQDSEPGSVGFDCVDMDPPCGNMENAGVKSSGKDQLECVLVEGVNLSDEVIDGGLQLDDCVDGIGVLSTSGLPVFGSLGPCTLNHSIHSIPSVPLSPDVASSTVEELVARQGPSVSELVFRLESAGDTDKEFDRHSDSGDGCRSESRILDDDMGAIKKRKETAFHKSRKKRQGGSRAHSP